MNILSRITGNLVRSPIRRAVQSRSILPARWPGLALLVIAAQLLIACADRATPIPPTVGPPTAASSTATHVPALTPTIDCVDDAKFIVDVSVLDGTHMMPGTPFTKTWQIRNSGTCLWSIGYQLKFIGGPSLNGSSVNLPQSIHPGGTLDLSIALTAPITAGHYRARWRLFAADGTPFGPTLFTDINVP
ncbi:MAG TPA: NBR1-Ig-like domain-containing protein [Anaerolineae bacterium]|nr:NBR1-Ig-like domain-containing protein [Anaerolineae bacterium]